MGPRASTTKNTPDESKLQMLCRLVIIPSLDLGKSDGGAETIIAQAPTYFSNFSESLTRTTTHPTQLSISKILFRVKNLAAEI